MLSEVLNEHSRFDPTPDQIAEAAEAHWRSALTAMEVEQRGVADRVAQLTISLDALDKLTPADRGDASAIAHARLGIAEERDHKIARLAHIGHTVAAHRKAKP